MIGEVKMNLDGGLLNYTDGRYNDGEKPLGRKVRYLKFNGRQGDKEHANRFFRKGQILEVKEIYISSSYSEVEFLSVPDETFNTVMFEDVDEEKLTDKLRYSIKQELAKANNNHELLVIAEDIKSLVDELVENYEEVTEFNIG